MRRMIIAMDANAFPDGVFQLDPDSPRYPKIRRELAPGEDLYGIYELRDRIDLKTDWPLMLVVIIGIFCVGMFGEPRGSPWRDRERHVLLAMCLIISAFFLLDAFRYGAWYAFSRDRLHIRVVYRMGIFSEQFAVDRNDIQRIDLSPNIPEHPSTFRIEAKLTNGKTIVLRDPDTNYARAKWLADHCAQWLRP